LARNTACTSETTRRGEIVVPTIDQGIARMEANRDKPIARMEANRDKPIARMEANKAIARMEANKAIARMDANKKKRKKPEWQK
jgi:hypothetical protein